jgi:hypothetical protein
LQHDQVIVSWPEPAAIRDDAVTVHLEDGSEAALPRPTVNELVVQMIDLSQVESVTWAWILWLIGSVVVALATAYLFWRLGRR